MESERPPPPRPEQSEKTLTARDKRPNPTLAGGISNRYKNCFKPVYIIFPLLEMQILFHILAHIKPL